MPPQDDIRSAVRAAPETSREPLAVVGIGCRLPGGINSPASFWEALLRGVDGIREVPEDRWRHSRFHDTNPEKYGAIRNAKGGFIDGIDQFDAEFFGYFPNEAQRMDPQQRILLEVTHEAMEDAGLRRDQLDGTHTSVFIGSFMYDYLCIQAATEQRDEINPYVAMGCAVSPLSNRISYDFNLKGPSATVDTACSSSLVALHLACRSLWNGEAEMAIAGGVNVMLRPESSIMLSKAGFLNPDQYCKAFDASANGYVRGEGAGVVILKPLSRALADGDDIYACIRGSGVNQDGYQPEGFTVPNMMAQIELLKSVYRDAGVDPLTVDYVEAHGTGTPVGDPIESLSLGAVLGRDRAEGDRCLIGSVKTNIGHLEGASGIAGFIKAALTARHGVVPPNRHFHEPNPEIDWLNLRLEVPTAPIELTRHGRPWTIGVNSFGAGGTNAHVVLESPHAPEASHSPVAPDEAHRPEVRACGEVPPTLYYLSASNRNALRALAERHADFLTATDADLADVAYSAFQRRSRYPHLLAIVGDDRSQLAAQLRKFADGQPDASILSQVIAPSKKPKIGWVFSGQGGQWAGMGLGLMDSEPVFRYWVEEVDAYFNKLSGWSLVDELRRGTHESRIDDTVVVQPAVMAIQIALAKLYEHYGIHPDGVVGHSIGEVAAAFVSGALTMEQAVQVIYQRSQAQSRAAGRGGMLAVGVGMEEAQRLIRPHAGRVSIGAVNGPEMLTLSGDTEPLAQIREALEARGVFARPVRVQVAYHSHHMDDTRDEMLRLLAGCQGCKAKISLYSTVSGRRESGAHLNAEYWYRNVREPVLFTDALAKMLHNQFDTLIEIGPHPVLISGAEALIKQLDADAVIGPSMKRRDCETTVFRHSLARLMARGVQPAVERLYGRGRRYVRLPQYAWQHERYWFEAPAATEQRRGRFAHPFLKRRVEFVTEPGLAIWEVSIDVNRFPYLRDHQVEGEIVFPATGHVEMAWAVADEAYRGESIFLENLQFDLPLILPDKSRHPLDVRLEVVSSEGDYRICSRAADAPKDTPWTKHSTGRINTAHDRFDDSALTWDIVRDRFQDDDVVPVRPFYETISAAGLNYGVSFRCVQQLWHRGKEALAMLTLPPDLTEGARLHAFHPALLDACLHVVFADVHRNGAPDRVYLPSHIDRIRFHDGGCVGPVWAHVTTSRNDAQVIVSDTHVYDSTGRLVAEVLGLTCKRLAAAGVDDVYQGCYELTWREAPRAEGVHCRIADYTRAVVVAPCDSAPANRELADDVVTRLSAQGLSCEVMACATAEALDERLESWPLDRRTLIVFLAGVQLRRVEWRTLDDCPAAWLGLGLAQSLQKREAVSRLAIVTNGAAAVDGDSWLNLGQAVLHGMARVVRNECPNMPVSLIDLSEQVTPDDVDSLCLELLHGRVDQDEVEVALRGSSRWVRCLAVLEREAAERAAITIEAGVGGGYRAEVAEAGALEHVVFRRSPVRALRDDEVEIAVEAAALNFKDVMNAMGLLPARAVAGGLAGDRLGLEVAGSVIRKGDSVDHVGAGDPVLARVSHGFAGRVIASGSAVVRRPVGLTAVQGAAVPVVYITAMYSLMHLARMSRGETVLVHSAAGGVGGAAIQLARLAGARVIATAGTRDKRDKLRQAGVEHVFDSRSLDFHNHVLEATQGRGVDIVLNSLSGRFISQSFKCLAPFGRFIELGKSDVYRNSKLGLERFGENISYFVVDVDRLAVHKPHLHRQVFEEVAARFEAGDLTPHEITEFPVTRIAEAMKYMSRAAYHGKIVLNMRDQRIETLPGARASFQSDRTYLITGGASGLGLRIAEWMTERGARHLVLLSRSGPKLDDDRRDIDAMRARGTRVNVAIADVSLRADVERVLAEVNQTMPPLAGIIHGAALLDDAALGSLDRARFERVFAPKAQGAWSLHAATQSTSLDFFVMLSSISSLLGLVGQTNYAAANHFLDALAVFRRQRGLPGTAVNLGVLGQYAGMSRAANDRRGIVGLLESQGLHGMPLADVLAKLEQVVVNQPVQRMTAKIDWRRFRDAYPHLARDVRYLDVMSDLALSRTGKTRGAGMRAELLACEPAQRAERIQQELLAKMAKSLDVAPDRIDVGVSIEVLGLDSLLLTDLQIWIMRLLDVNVPLIKLLKGPSIASLAIDLSHQLELSGRSSESASSFSPEEASEFTWADTDGIQIDSPWLIRSRGATNAPARLVCFHSLGVGASLFSRFLLDGPSDLEVLAIQTPGRENRRTEPPVDSVAELVDLLLPTVRPLLDRPVIFWGHSFGGIVAFELARRLRGQAKLEPAHLLVTGTVAPHLIHLWQKREVMLKAMATDNSPEYLISLARYVDDPQFLKSVIPLMRRDWPLLKNYRYQVAPPLDCPISAFAARQDDMVYADEISEWSHHTRSTFRLTTVDGDHWFLNRNWDLLISELRDIAGLIRQRRMDERTSCASVGAD